MAYIIADPCVSTCDTACVEVCPVDCIHGPEDREGLGAEAKEPGFNPEGKQLYINPEECIDCGACEPECPVEAIFEEDAVPPEWDKFIDKNYEFFGQKRDEQDVCQIKKQKNESGNEEKRMNILNDMEEQRNK